MPAPPLPHLLRGSTKGGLLFCLLPPYPHPRCDPPLCPRDSCRSLPLQGSRAGAWGPDCQGNLRHGGGGRRGVWGPEGQDLEGLGVGRRQLRDGDLERHCDIMKSAHLSAWCCLLCRRDLIESPPGGQCAPISQPIKLRYRDLYGMGCQLLNLAPCSLSRTVAIPGGSRGR